ncbi:hypothetical protein VNI00_015791 [Paramarasmius palmivorus]|uniref:DNA polymerase delta subunit 4 n=1 Tax=Paramarasmius palmivorus TaxID=297713 RepID=A0AAW0BJX5_9AGAR
MSPSRSEAGQPSGADIREFLPVVKRPKFQRVDLQAARTGKVAKKQNGQQNLNRVSTEMHVEGGAAEEEETSAEDRLLEVFDLDSTYGPTVGIKRLQRWDRARRLGLNPPMEVYVLLVDREGKEVEEKSMNVLDACLASYWRSNTRP